MKPPEESASTVTTTSKLEMLLCASCAVYVFYYVLAFDRRPRLVGRLGRVGRFLDSRFGNFLRAFYRTPIWCVGANFQSLVSFLFQSWLPELSYRREYLILSDGGRLALDWLNEEVETVPVLLVLPGLCGDSQAYYLRSFIPQVEKLRCPCVVMNGRGRGGLPLSTHRITHMASVGDLTEVVDEVRRRYPGRALLAVGYSLGGLLVSLYLIKYGEEARIDAALAISTPFHLATAKRNLEQWWNSNYGVLLYMASNLVEHLKINEDVLRFSEEVNADAVLSCWTLSQFDKNYTAPVFGFKSTDELYESCSLKGKLSRVRRPLVFLLAGDDVFGSWNTFPEDEIIASPWLAAVATPSGGHLGFVEGWLFPRPPFYAERFAAAYVREMLRVVETHGVDGLAQLGNDI
ncbi:phospholipase ABHD3 isoform X2 [Dermacentor silvarum]|nr:phospholipase ABHD3 isoform X2 [Dermacentor silvarum]